MKLKIKQSILKQHLNIARKGISNKNLIPILNCIKFDLKKEGLYLMSTDNDIAIKTFIPKKEIEEIDEIGTIVVSGRFIDDIISRLPNESVTLEEAVDSKLLIYNENSSFNLNCNRVSEFPDLEMEEHKTPIYIDKKVFKTVIFQTSFAASSQESRPVLTGINFKIDDNNLEITATDSYRLAKKSIILEGEIPENINIIISKTNLLEIAKLIYNEDDKLELHIFNNKVIFKFDNIIVLTRLINGNYPDTTNSISKKSQIELTVNLNEFTKAIDRASLLTNEADKNTIKLINKGNEITLLSNIPEIGNVEEKLNVEKNKDEDIKTAFSSTYMLDALKAFDSEEIKILFNGEIKPIILKSTTDDGLIQLISPIRTY